MEFGHKLMTNDQCANTDAVMKNDKLVQNTGKIEVVAWSISWQLTGRSNNGCWYLMQGALAIQ